VKSDPQRTNEADFSWTQGQSAPERTTLQPHLAERKSTWERVQEEYFVDANVAAKFLSITRKYLLKLSRLGIIPAHPLGIGSRKQWRYRISELAEWALAQRSIQPDNVSGSPRAAKRRK